MRMPQVLVCTGLEEWSSISHRILLMDNAKDSAECASRLNTCSFSSKCLMSLEKVGRLAGLWNVIA